MLCLGRVCEEKLDISFRPPTSAHCPEGSRGTYCSCGTHTSLPSLLADLDGGTLAHSFEGEARSAGLAFGLRGAAPAFGHRVGNAAIAYSKLGDCFIVEDNMSGDVSRVVEAAPE